MKTLSVLHRDLVPETEVLTYVQKHPVWELTSTSSDRGGSPLYYKALTGTGPRLLPESWTTIEIDSFRFVWPEMALISVQVEDQEYEDIISFVSNGSLDRAPEVDEVG